MRLQFTLFIELAFLLYEPIDNVLPLLFQFFGCLSVAPSALLHRLWHYEKYAVDKSVARSLAFTQLSEYLLLNSPYNRDIGSLDEDETL